MRLIGYGCVTGGQSHAVLVHRPGATHRDWELRVKVFGNGDAIFDSLAGSGQNLTLTATAADIPIWIDSNFASNVTVSTGTDVTVAWVIHELDA